MNPIQPQNILPFVNDPQIDLHYPYPQQGGASINTQMMTPVYHLLYISNNQTPFLSLPGHLTNPQEGFYQDHCVYENVLGSNTNTLSFEPSQQYDRYSFPSGE